MQGNVWWHGYWVTDNYKGVADSLALKYQSTFALPPAYGDKTKKPAPVKDLSFINNNGKTFLTWDSAVGASLQQETDVVKYVVYQFFPGEQIDIEDAQTIIAITPYTSVLVEDYSEGPSAEGSTFVVTTIDRMNRESEPRKITAKVK